MFNKAYGVLDFIKRWAKKFSDPYVTKQLYTALVKHIIEYRSVIWDSGYITYIDKIESVSKQCLLFSLRHFHWNGFFNLPSYANRLRLTRLVTLKRRRILLYSIMKGIFFSLKNKIEHIFQIFYILSTNAYRFP